MALTYKEAKKTGEFTIPGLGKLVKIKRKARLGRNPFTGQALKIAAKTALKFRVSKTAKDAVLGAKREAAAPKGKAAKAAKPKGR
jgi:DNA-binding protein HU-beta